MSESQTPDLEQWLEDHRITEIECMVSDMAGIARGKIIPTRKFITGLRERSLKLPESIFGQTVTGDYIDSEVLGDIEPDVILDPDVGTVRIVPWYDEPTAQIICDANYRDGTPVPIAPRNVLRKVLELYEERGWRPVVAPEIEFYLAAKNIDPDYPLETPVGANGRQEKGRQSYGIDAVNEFDPIFEDMYDFCEAQGLDIDTLIHESGAAQVEINFDHGDPLEIADQAFLFKRTMRQAALRHGIYATFMAKPYEGEPGSAMHIHQSIVDAKSGETLFATKQGKDTKLFLSFIAGQQKYLPAAMPLLAPNVNSYRRIVRDHAAPINTHWGHENRTVGLRIPEATRSARRVENRVPGADANRYLAIATTLACGYLGMVDELKPSKEMVGNAYESKIHALPRHLLDVKYTEHEAYQQVISAWEREHLLLNV